MRPFVVIGRNTSSYSEGTLIAAATAASAWAAVAEAIEVMVSVRWPEAVTLSGGRLSIE